MGTYYNRTLFSLFFILLFMNPLNAKESIEKVSLQLQWLDQFQFAGYYMAKEKGFYKEVGLELTLKSYSNDISVVDEVVRGNATYGTGRSTLLIDRSHGKDITALAAIFQSSPLILLGLKRDDLSSITNFKDKRFMSLHDTSSTAAVQAMIASHGISLSDMKIQTHSLNLNDLIEGNTDLMASYLSNEPYILGKKGIEYTIFDPKEYGFNFYGDILFTSDDEVKHHPKRTKKFLHASLKGWEYAFSHIKETAELIFKHYNSQNKSLDALIFEGEILKQLALVNGIPLGDINPNRLQKIFDIYKVLHLTQKDLFMHNFIFTKNSIKLTEEEKRYIQMHKTLNICMNLDFPPYILKDESQYTGITVDYLSLITQKTNLDFHYLPIENKINTVSYLKNKQCDIIPYLSTHDTAHTLLNPTHKYIDEHIAMVTSVNHPYINNLHDVKNEKIGIIHCIKHLSSKITEHYPNIEFIELTTPEIAFRKIRSGEIDGFLGPYKSLSYSIQKSYIGELKIAIKLVSPKLEIGFGVKKENPILLSILNKTLQSLTPDEQHYIYQRWLNTSAMTQQTSNYTLLIQLMTVMVLILAVIIYRHQLLKKKNSELNLLKNELEKLNRSLEVKISSSVNELRKKDQLMMYQSRLAQLGEMISMIAHQWRQPLAAISSTVVSIQLKNSLGHYDLSEKASQENYITYLNENFNKIETYVQTLSSTIDDFRNFYRSEKILTLAPVNNTIKKTLKIVESSLHTDNITLIKKLNSQKNIEIYENELLQVFLNLIKNAHDNFKEKSIQDPRITIASYDTDNSVKIEISDNGGGIAESLHAKIYDPYFSTKSKKNGTGLGLYMSKMIIEEHHKGKLTHQNRDKGVCFCIEIFTP